MNHDEILVFGGSGSRKLAAGICQYLNIEPGQGETLKFSEGNLFVRILENVRGRHVYLVQSTAFPANDNFMELLFWCDAFNRASAQSVTAIIPYFSYAKGDKKDEPRVSIRARVCADAIESAGADRVVTMDLHSPQVQGFFKKPVDHLFALPVLCEYIKKLNLDNYVVVSPDSGFAKRTRKFGSYLGVSVALGDKVRKAHDEKVELLDIIGEVEGKNAIIVDDFSISGGTLIETAKGLKQRGAKQILACLSHILLNKEGVARIEDSPIELLLSTDSVDNGWVLNSEKIKIVSVAPLFGEAINRIHARESVSPLFDAVPDGLVDRSVSKIYK